MSSPKPRDNDGPAEEQEADAVHELPVGPLHAEPAAPRRGPSRPPSLSTSAMSEADEDSALGPDAVRHREGAPGDVDGHALPASHTSSHPLGGGHHHRGEERHQRRRHGRRGGERHRLENPERSLSAYALGDLEMVEEDDERQRSACHEVLRLIGLRAEVPGVRRRVVMAGVVVSWNAIMMCVAEALMEVLMHTYLIYAVEFRLCFTLLTLLSALLAVHALSDIQQDQLDTTVQALRTSFFVELALIMVDTEFVLATDDAAQSGDERFYRLVYRVPFMVLTFVNLALIVLQLYDLGLMQTAFGIPLCFPKACHFQRASHAENGAANRSSSAATSAATPSRRESRDQGVLDADSPEAGPLPPPSPSHWV